MFSVQYQQFLSLVCSYIRKKAKLGYYAKLFYRIKGERLDSITRSLLVSEA